MAALGFDNSSDDSLAALQVILAAWDEGDEKGIAPELMAYAALYAALTDLVGRFGEQNVSRMVDGLRNRVLKGEFTLAERLQ